MSITGKEAVIKFVERNKHSYWRIYSSGAGASRNNYIYSSSDEDNLILKDSLEHLSECLDSLETGKYIISSKEKANQTKALAETPFNLYNTNASSPVAPINGGLGMNINGSPISLADIVRTEVDKFKAEWENAQKDKKIAELESKVKEYENDGENNFAGVFNRLEKRVGPYVELVLDNKYPEVKKTKIAAVGYGGKESKNNTTTMDGIKYTAPPSAPTTDEEAGARVTAALKAWRDADANALKEKAAFLSVIEKIADTAVNDPEKYKMYSAMLLS